MRAPPDLSDPTTLSLLRMACLGLAPGLFSAAATTPSGPAAPTDDPVRGLVAEVSAIGALQSQDWRGALHSLAMRDPGRSPAVVRRAFDTGGLIRSWPMRGTLHTVAAADLAWLLGATHHRIERLTARRREELGVTEALLDRALDLAHQALSSHPCSRGEVVGRWREEGLIGEVPGRAYLLFMTLCVRGELALGPIGESGDQLVVELSPSQLVPDPDGDYPRRYFRGHGPADLADLARWSGLPRTLLRAGLERARARGDLRRTEVAGRELWHRADLETIPEEALDACRSMVLLPGFDELLVGYRDRSCTIPREQERLICPGGNGVFRHTIVENGRVVGTWRRDRTGQPVPEFFGGPTRRRSRAFEHAADRLPA